MKLFFQLKHSAVNAAHQQSPPEHEPQLPPQPRPGDLHAMRSDRQAHYLQDLRGKFDFLDCAPDYFSTQLIKLTLPAS